MINEIERLVGELKVFDNKEGYNFEYEDVKEKLNGVVEKLSKCGEGCLEYVHPLLAHEETWSSLFALKIVRRIKSFKSVKFLIDFIIDNENGDYGDNCEDAMFALNDIGEPAIEPLLKEIKSRFRKKEFYIYLVGALTEIKNEKVYLFMVDIVRDYIKNEEKYDEWFHVDQFACDFDKQGRKDVLPLLKELVTLDRLSRHERIEIESTIKMIEDRELWKKELEREWKEAKPLIDELMKEEGPERELSKKEREEIQERMKTSDDNLELQFKCHDCNKKQNIKPGLIRQIGDKSIELSFENEMMCKFCFSNNVKLTKDGKRDVLFQGIGTLGGYRQGVLSMDNEIMVENKKMHFKKSYPYILERIKEEPNNGELFLRAGNIARVINKYSEAIKHYERSLELNPELIAAYINLVEIYEYRYRHYKIGSAKGKAIDCLRKMVELFRSQNFDCVTLKDRNGIIPFIGEKSESFGIKIPGLVKLPESFATGRKIGRNEPCLCGSGKKYKKCCLDKNESIVIEDGGDKEMKRMINEELDDEFDNDNEFVLLNKLLIEDNEKIRELKSIYKREDEYLDVLGPIEHFIARHYYENPKLKDRDLIKAIKQVRENYDKDIDFFSDELKEGLIGTISLSLQNRKKKITRHELFLILGHILWAIDNRTILNDSQAYLKWIANFFGLLNDEEKRNFEKTYEIMGNELDIDKKILDVMQGKPRDIELPIRQEALSLKDSEKFANYDGDSIWSDGSYIKPINLNDSDYEERMRYFEERSGDPRDYKCEKCNKAIGKHNLYWHEGMCSECFFDEYNM